MQSASHAWRRAISVAAFAAISWTALPTYAASGLAWSNTIDIAAGRGERGPWRQNESRYDYVDDPTVAIDKAAQVAVAWVEQGKKDVFFQRIDADGRPLFKQPVNVSRSPTTFSWLPRILFAPDDASRVFLLWQEIIFTSGGSHGGEIMFAQSHDGGVTFSPPLNLSNSVPGDGKGRINPSTWHNGSLDLAVSANGTLYAAWTEYDGPLWFSRSDDGKSFSAPRHIAGNDTRPARAPALAAGPDGTLYLAWTVGETQAAAIHVAKSSDGGLSFGEPVLAGHAKSYADAPKLAVDASGTLHLAYAQSMGGPFEGYRVHYTYSADGAQSFAPPRDISTPLPAPAQSAAYPMLAIDGQNNLYVSWELFPDHRQYPRGMALAISRDRGNNFSPPGIVPDSIDPAGGINGSVQGLLMKKLAVNANGQIAIVNSSLKQNKESRVRLMRANPASLPSSIRKNLDGAENQNNKIENKANK